MATSRICLFWIISLLMLAMSCENHDINGMPDALLSVVADYENCNCDPVIRQYIWEGQTVYVLGGRHPACLWAPAFFDAQGREFQLPAGYSYPDFIEDSSFVRVAWSCTAPVATAG